jgi:hypothetical protein
MFDGRFICTLTALIVAVVAICNFNPSKGDAPVLEGLGMLPSRVLRPSVLARHNGKTSVLQDTYNTKLWSNSPGLATGISNAPGVSGPDFFQTPGTFQSNLSPRFANTQFGSQIRYNAPSFKNMGVPCNPLGYAKMAKENYTEEYGCGSCGGGAGCFAADCAGPAKGQSPKSCAAGSAPPLMKADYLNGNAREVLSEAIDSHPASDGFTNTLPVGNMSTLNNMGEQLDNVIVYDRMMFANRNSHLRSQGDWIRGDLPIVPSSTGWFQVSVDPAIDLNQGAMNVLGGVQNETAGALANIINTTTGMSTIGGINMSQQELASVGASGNDLNVTAFP